MFIQVLSLGAWMLLNFNTPRCMIIPISRTRTMLVLTVFLACASAVTAEDCVRPPPDTNEVRLHQKLLDVDEWYLFPPTKNCTDVLQVKIRIIPQYFKLDVHEESFSFHMWLTLTWKDELLTWEPKDYGNIEETVIRSYYIWDPMMILEGLMPSVKNTVSSYSAKSINYTGQVYMNAVFSESVPCKVDMRNWPYDTQVCSYTFGDLQQQWHPVNFWVHNVSEDVEFIDPGPGWSLFRIRQSRTDLSNFYKNVTNATMHTVKLTFEIRREATVFSAIVIVRSVILVVLTMTSQLLETEGHLRVGLLIFNIFNHLNVFAAVDISVPQHGGDVPSIITFLSVSLTVTCISLVMTLLLKALSEREISPPYWIVSMKDSILKLWIIPRSGERADSTECAIVINVFCTLVFSVIYLWLIVKALPMNYNNDT